MVKCGEFVIRKSIEDWIDEKEIARQNAQKEKEDRMNAPRLEAQRLKQNET